MRDTVDLGKPDVSVLMSCYNAARWLDVAIESVLAQTFENFEFIIVDDGSTDNTWNIIQHYSSRDGRIVAVSKDNSGLADSLNVGIAAARGEWIARLDADDLCEATRLEEQLRFVRDNSDVVLLGTDYFEVDEHNQVIRAKAHPKGHRMLVYHLERMKRFFAHSSAFYNALMAQQAGGYNTRIRRAEDLRLWLEMSSRGRIACLSKPLIRYRKHTDQISLDDRGRRQLCDAVAAITCHFLQKAGCEDPSTDADGAEWTAFLEWVEREVDASLILERLRTWEEAKEAYFAARSRMIGLMCFVQRLVGCGHAGSLLWAKVCGTRFPRRLAQKWMRHQKASSEK